MTVIDGHSHAFQVLTNVEVLKTGVSELDNFNANTIQKKLTKSSISVVQTMPQEMTRKRGKWLGSNKLSADLQHSIPDKIVAFAAAEPLDIQDVFNRERLEEITKAIREDGLKGLLLTPPYGHYYSNDKRVYPFYERVLELDIPIYFHHSHMFGDSKNCPLKYARVWLLDDLTIDFPKLRFNVEHMGYPWTEELLAIMSRSKNVFTDIAMFVYPPSFAQKRHLLLARNLGMAREYGVLDRVFYGSDYVGDNIDEYIEYVGREISYLTAELNNDMRKIGYEPLTDQEIEGMISKNVLKLWRS